MTEANKKITDITIDGVEEAFNKWRAERMNGGSRSIPDALWQQVFQLENEGLTGERLRRFFQLNSAQYQKKREELIDSASSTPSTEKSTVDQPPRFSELTVNTNGKLSPTQQTLKNIKHTKLGTDALLDKQTMILECKRSDGHCLHMHISIGQVDQIFDAFLKSEVSP